MSDLISSEDFLELAKEMNHDIRIYQRRETKSGDRRLGFRDDYEVRGRSIRGFISPRKEIGVAILGGIESSTDLTAYVTDLDFRSSDVTPETRIAEHNVYGGQLFRVKYKGYKNAAKYHELELLQLPEESDFTSDRAGEVLHLG